MTRGPQQISSGAEGVRTFCGHPPRTPRTPPRNRLVISTCVFWYLSIYIATSFQSKGAYLVKGPQGSQMEVIKVVSRQSREVVKVVRGDSQGRESRAEHLGFCLRFYAERPRNTKRSVRGTPNDDSGAVLLLGCKRFFKTIWGVRYPSRQGCGQREVGQGSQGRQSRQS